MSDKKPLFTVTARDCEWSYTKGSGNGGQKKNKTSSAVHCMHRPSGAHGYSEASRSQADNKQEAFQKMSNLPEFQRWLNLEFMKRSGEMAEVERYVQRELTKVKTEIKIDGVWTEVNVSQLSHGQE